MIKTRQSLYFHKKKIKSSGYSDTCENTYCSWALLGPNHSSGRGESCKKESVVRTASHSSSPHSGALQSRCQPQAWIQEKAQGPRSRSQLLAGLQARVCADHTQAGLGLRQSLSLPERPFWTTSHLRIWHSSRVWRKIIQTIWECASLINLIKELASQSLTI